MVAIIVIYILIILASLNCVNQNKEVYSGGQAWLQLVTFL